MEGGTELVLHRSLASAKLAACSCGCACALETYQCHFYAGACTKEIARYTVVFAW